MPPQVLTELLKLDKLTSKHAWYIQEASCTNGDGVMEAANELVNMIQQYRKEFGPECS